MSEGVVKGVVIAVCVVVVLLTILLATSFSDIAYDEIGFKQRKSSGYVSTDNVYTMGNHLVGPDYKFKKFKSVAHLESMDNVAVFASDRLEVWVTCTFQYFLRPEELHLLHEKFDIYYNDIVSSNALDALKVAATSYSTDEFIGQRARVEAAMFKAVRERLGGTCCERGCEDTDTCADGCKAQSECLDTERGLFVSVKFYQMQQVVIPEDVADRHLQALVLQEQTERAGFQQTATVVEQITEEKVQVFRNQASEVSEQAEAKAALITSEAQANATAIIEKSRSDGLRGLYTRLSLTEEDYRSSFDYLRSIRQMDNAHLTVDFNQLITGPVGTR